jgi:hypothetical protein
MLQNSMLPSSRVEVIFWRLSNNQCCAGLMFIYSVDAMALPALLRLVMS